VQHLGQSQNNADTNKPGSELDFRVARGTWVLVPSVEALHERSQRGQDQDDACYELKNATRH